MRSNGTGGEPTAAAADDQPLLARSSVLHRGGEVSTPRLERPQFKKRRGTLRGLAGARAEAAHGLRRLAVTGTASRPSRALLLSCLSVSGRFPIAPPRLLQPLQASSRLRGLSTAHIRSLPAIDMPMGRVDIVVNLSGRYVACRTVPGTPSCHRARPMSDERSRTRGRRAALLVPDTQAERCSRNGLPRPCRIRSQDGRCW